jgi:hypothetical protein
MAASASQPDFVLLLLRRLASQIFATEAFAFSTVGIGRAGQPQVICHIRPDGASQAKVEAAR